MPATPSLIPTVSLARLIRSSACCYPELSPAPFPYLFAEFVLVETAYLLGGRIALQDVSSGLDLHIFEYRLEFREDEEDELLELIEQGCPFPDVPFPRIVQSSQSRLHRLRGRQRSRHVPAVCISAITRGSLSSVFKGELSFTSFILFVCMGFTWTIVTGLFIR